MSRSGFYGWRDRPESATAARRAELTVLITAIFDGSDGTYGYRRVHPEVGRRGVQAGPELVRASMRAQQLVACQPRPWRQCLTAQGAAGPIPDLVDRDFTDTVPGTKLVDITAIRNGQVMPDGVFHSDRGSNYTSAEFAAALAAQNIRQSVGRTGICY